MKWPQGGSSKRAPGAVVPFPEELTAFKSKSGFNLAFLLLPQSIVWGSEWPLKTGSINAENTRDEEVPRLNLKEMNLLPTRKGMLFQFIKKLVLERFFRPDFPLIRE